MLVWRRGEMTPTKRACPTLTTSAFALVQQGKTYDHGEGLSPKPKQSSHKKLLRLLKMSPVTSWDRSRDKAWRYHSQSHMACSPWSSAARL
eukprot:450662-Amphidinium_carterae.1